MFLSFILLKAPSDRVTLDGGFIMHDPHQMCCTNFYLIRGPIEG